MDTCTYGGGNCTPTPPTTVVTVPSTSSHTTPNSSLPFTGGDVAGLALVGTMLVAIGIGLIKQPSRKARLAAAQKFMDR